jgi:hypothetical protein
MMNDLHRQNERAVASLIQRMAHASAIDDCRRLSELLAYSLGRVLLKAARKAGTDLDGPLYEDRFGHIVDWLVAALVNGAQWLDHVDEKGRPRKLMKFSDVEGILKEADKAMLRFARQQASVRLAEGHEELAFGLPDGWYVVRLLTPEALDHESGQMQHCIGQGAYDARLADPAFAYFSLRDPYGKAHATMEADMRDMVPIQIQGKQNREPLPQYIDRMLDFMKSVGIKPIQLSETSPWVFDENWKRHDVCDLPDGVVLVGRINLRDRSELRFPSTMTVKGELDIRGCHVDRMPDTLVVSDLIRVEASSLDRPIGKLVMAGKGHVIVVSVGDRPIAETAENVTKIVFEGCQTAWLPKGLDGSAIRFLNCKAFVGMEHITSLKALRVEACASMPMTHTDFTTESLFVIETPCPVFGGQTKFSGDVVMRDCGLVRLPDGLEVAGSLNIGRNPVTVIPDDTRVGGSLDIRNTPIAVIPSEIGNLHSLRASRSALASIEGLSVQNDMDISHTQVTSIPTGLRLLGSLSAEGAPIVGIGAGVEVGGYLSISRTNIEFLPPDMKVGKGLDASYSSLRALPANFDTNGPIRLTGTDISELPEGLHVYGPLVITTTRIKSFPPGVVIDGDLICRDGCLDKVADDTIIRGDIEHPAGRGVLPRPLEGFIYELAKGIAAQNGPKP